MAQSAITVTTPNPSPPTNYAFVGATPPAIVPNYTKLTYLNYPRDFVTNPPPFFDDFAASPGSTINEPATTQTLAVRSAFITNKAALASGTSAADTAGGTGISTTAGTYPGAGTYGDRSATGTVSAFGVVPASTSVAHEGAGSTVTVSSPGNLALVAAGGTVPVGAETAVVIVTGAGGFTGVANPPNQSHASSLSPTTNPALTSATPGNTTAGGGNTTLAVVGTNFTPQSVVWYGGVAYPTTYVSATSLTVAAVPKKATAGTIPVFVVTGGAVQTASVNATYV